MARAVTHLSRSTPKPATKQCQNRQQCRRTTATSHQQCTQVVVAASARAVVGATSSIDSPARQALFVTVTRPRHRYSSRGDSHRHIVASLPHRSCRGRGTLCPDASHRKGAHRWKLDAYAWRAPRRFCAIILRRPFGFLCGRRQAPRSSSAAAGRGIGFAARARHPAVGSFGRLRGSVVVV